VGTLSGGERNRVHLAKLLRGGANLLLLDEPTNDLDVDTLRSLEEGITSFAGSVVVITHDRWFLDRLATHIIAFEGDGYVHVCEGNFEVYERSRKERQGVAAVQLEAVREALTGQGQPAVPRRIPDRIIGGFFAPGDASLITHEGGIAAEEQGRTAGQLQFEGLDDVRRDDLRIRHQSFPSFGADAVLCGSTLGAFAGDVEVGHEGALDPAPQGGVEAAHQDGHSGGHGHGTH
jgi:energy-coupling factor transporter ATP-binding protein EcfA2